MRKSVRLLLVFALSSVCAGMVSCKREPLIDPMSGVYLSIDLVTGSLTDLEPFLDPESEGYLLDKLVGNVPELMKVYFYDADTHELEYEDFLDVEGGFVGVDEGRYDIIVYGYGTERTRVTGENNRGGFYSFTNGLGSRLKMTRTKVDEETGEEEVYVAEFPIIYEPDPIYVGRLADVVVPVREKIERTIYLETVAKNLLESYTFEVLNLEGAERIKTATCYVTGQASSKFMWDGRYPGEACAITFTVPYNRSTQSLKTVFNTFGKFPGERNDVYLNILVTSDGGGMYQWIYDVTDQFDDPDNVDHRIIISDKIIIPDREMGGFTPTVNDWNAEIITVPL